MQTTFNTFVQHQYQSIESDLDLGKNAMCHARTAR